MNAVFAAKLYLILDANIPAISKNLKIPNYSAGLPMARIYLIGARGSGKTTVGRHLAKALAYDFLDLDEYLCNREACSVADIVEKHGWPGFRKIETEVLEETSRRDSLVLATGGGVILAPGNRQFLRDSGTVIWLKASPHTLVDRLTRDLAVHQRPSLTGANPVEEISTVLAQREPLYQEACHHSLNADAAPDVVCDSILKLIR